MILAKQKKKGSRNICSFKKRSDPRRSKCPTVDSIKCCQAAMLNTLGLDSAVETRFFFSPVIPFFFRLVSFFLSAFRPAFGARWVFLKLSSKSILFILQKKRIIMLRVCHKNLGIFLGVTLHIYLFTWRCLTTKVISYLSYLYLYLFKFIFGC